MRKTKISAAMGNIDLKYVNEATAYADEVNDIRRLEGVKWIAIVACLCLMITTIIAAPAVFDVKTEKQGESASDETGSTVISSFKSDSITDSCYVTPKPGEYFCFTEVNAARKEYAGKDVNYLLGFDVFNSNREKIGIKDLSEEYQRLSDLGYKLYYVEDHWTYYGNSQKEYYPVVVGAFTEEELANFNVSEQYGYAFYFVTNGDGSSLIVDEDDIISDFNSDLY